MGRNGRCRNQEARDSRKRQQESIADRNCIITSGREAWFSTVLPVYDISIAGDYYMSPVAQDQVA